MEKFIVSARKYRPQTFDTVVGQEHITTTLKNAIKNKQLAHAFLFCGPRGVGKTTCARILAKTINCGHSTPDGDACNECESCLSFNKGTSLNLHELDAASNNSVDDIRTLVEQVRFAQQAGTYKVYIIDEVHMLSSAAFNAFLKTLEEPPPYTIFILATTEKHKILPTILSRCQIFDFKRITLQDTVTHLAGIAQKEQFNAEETALQLIAQKSEGCMRDALSILDKIVSFTDGEVTYPNTIEHLNILDADYYFSLMDCMLQQDLSGALLLYDSIDKKGFEGDAVLNGFAEFLRNVLICKDERVAVLLEVVESFKQRYAATAQRSDAGLLVSALNILSEAEINYRSARNKRLHVEMVLIKLCYLQQALELTNSSNGIDKKKVAQTAKAIAFKALQPIAVTPYTIEKETLPSLPQQPETSKLVEAKLIIETTPPPKVAEPVVAYKSEPQQPKPKLGSLDSLRQKIKQESCNEQAIDQPLAMPKLQAAWAKVVERFKEAKNPCAQSFELAGLHIKDENSFVAIVNNNINQKFLELERNAASDFLKTELCNKVLQFGIEITDTPQEIIITDAPLSAKDQYAMLVAEFPIVKELKDRLRLELDY